MKTNYRKEDIQSLLLTLYKDLLNSESKVEKVQKKYSTKFGLNNFEEGSLKGSRATLDIVIGFLKHHFEITEEEWEEIVKSAKEPEVQD